MQLKREDNEFVKYLSYRTQQQSKQANRDEIITYVNKCKSYIKNLVQGTDPQNVEIGKIFEIADQVVYVYLAKILLNASKKFVRI